MKQLLLIFAFFALLSCEDRKMAEAAPAQVEDFSQPIDITTNRKVVLTQDARQHVNEWLAYATAQDEIESLKEQTGSEIMASSNSIMQIMESLKSTIPDTLRSQAVDARANVLLTKARVLHQVSSKKNKDAEEVYQLANDLIVAFDNFKLQLNELFLKTPGQFDLELDREYEESKFEDPIPELEPPEDTQEY